MDAQQIGMLYEDMGYPSTASFYKALRRRGVQVRMSDIEKELTKYQSSRQVTGPKPKYDGKIVSFDFNHKWACDLISYVSKPSKNNEGTFRYVIIVQDIFSRFIWTRPLQNVMDSTFFFEEILKESEDRMVDGSPYPQELTTDGGPEWDNQDFKNLCNRYSIEHIIKAPNDFHVIATLDRAIGVLKKIIQRIQITQGGNWLTILDRAVNAYNNTENGTTKAEPKSVTDDEAFKMKQKAAVDLAHNTQLIRKRQDKLTNEGSYRIHSPGKQLKGLRQRIDANTWSKEIHQVKDFPAPGVVRDTNDIKTLTKFARPVPSDSSTLFATVDTMEPYAIRLKNILTGPKNMGQAAKEMKKEVGFTQTLKENKLTFRDFVKKYPRHIRINDGRIYPV